MRGDLYMKKYSKLIIIIAVLCITAVVGTGLIWQNKHIPTKIVYHSKADTDVNFDDPREAVGSSRYVFIGKIEETYDYYVNKASRKFPEIADYFGGEFTECRIKIVDAIKGDLTVGNTFSYYKVGGITENRACIALEEGDILPETGKYYLFTGIAHADGTMTGGVTIQLEDGITEDNLNESKIYQEYVDGFNNQILPKTKGLYPDFLCTADKNFGDGSYNAELYSEYVKKTEELDREYAEKHSMSYEKKYSNDEYHEAVKKGNSKIK